MLSKTAEENKQTYLVVQVVNKPFHLPWSAARGHRGEVRGGGSNLSEDAWQGDEDDGGEGKHDAGGGGVDAFRHGIVSFDCRGNPWGKPVTI